MVLAVAVGADDDPSLAPAGAVPGDSPLRGAPGRRQPPNRQTRP
ncbi:hypothetical protein U4E84_18575 [Halorubrum sp. AD140]|nr:hypothetical protein [Halorubrum sp. AD140]MDZ5813339.1 hypothetical protein [Halorubrum sp. AD140]